MLARSIGGPIGWRFLVAMVTRLRASYESRLVVLFAFPQVLPILAKGEDADEGEKSEGQDGEAGIGGGRIDHAEGDGGDVALTMPKAMAAIARPAARATSPPLAAAMTSKPRMANGISRTARPNSIMVCLPLTVTSRRHYQPASTILTSMNRAYQSNAEIGIAVIRPR